MLYSLAVFIFVVVCILLMGIILMQSSKTGGMGSAMGGGAINTAFGGQGADKLLVRITSGLAIAFMLLAIIIGTMKNPESRIDFSNKPTLNRNKGIMDILPTAPIELQTLDQSIPALKAPLNTEEKSE